MKACLLARSTLRPEVQYKVRIAEEHFVEHPPTSVSLVLKVLLWAGSSSAMFDREGVGFLQPRTGVRVQLASNSAKISCFIYC